MPVTTETFRNQTVLHRVFFVAASLLALATLIAVFQDWWTEYRTPQVQARVWNAAYTEWEQGVLDYKARRMDLHELEAQAKAVKAELDANEEYQGVLAEIASKTVEKGQIEKDLGLFITGNIAPVQQRIEWLQSLEWVQDPEAVNAELVSLRDELAYLEEQKRVGQNKVVKLEDEIAELKARQRDIEQPYNDLKARIDAVKVEISKTEERLAQLDPDLWGKIGQTLRDFPLMDWLNPSIKVKQQVVDGVLNDVNLMQVRTLDRCMSCHVNIDDPKFSEENMLAFLERQIAADRGEDVMSMGDEIHPVVMLDFWERAVAMVDARSLDGRAGERSAEARAEAVSAYNRLLSQVGADHPIRQAWMAARPAEGDAPARLEGADDLHAINGVMAGLRPDDWVDWYRPLVLYRDALQQIVDDSLDKDDRRAFYDQYRETLVAEYNRGAAEDSDRKRLSASRLMLAHPNLDLYAHPDSRHPIATMGCTSCHAGSGEETQFLYTAHTPSDVWVDAETGRLVPEVFVEETGPRTEIIRFLNDRARSASAPAAPAGAEIVRTAFTPAAAGDTDAEVHDGAGDHAHGDHDDHGVTTIHADLFYADAETTPNPFGPPHVEGGHGETIHAVYLDPASGEYRRAIKQREHWEEAHGWHEIEYHYWERPMHELRYVESSCNRCHTQIMDIEHAAPTLATGRVLFAEIGCVNCHPVDSLGSPIKGQQVTPDVRQVGPSLVHVKEKLSESMIASWTFAPKAFRPNTRMPHFWLLENNSSPLDIRRSRAEVAAIAHYLVNAELDEDDPVYEPEPVPTDLTGNPSTGREIFKAVGCMACHANVNEYGLEWVLLDLQERYGLDRSEAQQRLAQDAQALAANPDAVDETNVGFFELDGHGNPTPRIRPDQYTRLSWYLMAYESERYSRFGPDLSGVGTKLLADRTEEQATAWLYDWLRNPKHYSDYTVMPSLRLSEQEAMDLAAYLLTQKHPSYEVQTFEPDEPMIDALLVNLQANAISEAKAREQVEKMSLDEKQFDLGQRMIQHYGCFGCHQISGFDSNLAVSANLSAWGRRDPHKLDFGYFDHVYEHSRPEHVEIWKTHRAGTTTDAVQIDERDVGEGIERVAIGWEPVHVDRRGYLEAKLFNTRIFDRNKVGLDGAMTEDGEILWTDRETGSRRLVERDGTFVDAETGADSGLKARDVRIMDVGEPYLKLRMPNFFLPADQVHALVTYVTSLQDPMVRENLQDVTTPEGRMRAKGRLMAEAFNCMACHNIENNQPLIQQYYLVRDDNGEINYSETQVNLVNAPPRIVGNGSKTQHDWFYKFLNDVVMLRPWLEIRMPSFHPTPQQSQWLVEYIAGDSAEDARALAEALGDADAALWNAFRRAYDAEYDAAIQKGNRSDQADTIAKAAAARAVGELLLEPANDPARQAVFQFASAYELMPPNQLPAADMPVDEQAAKYGQLYYDLRFLRDTFAAVDYPFQTPPAVEMSDLEFHRGWKLIDTLGCLKCHAFGDYDKLEKIFAINLEQTAAPADEEEYEGYGEEDSYEGYGEEEDSYEGYGEDDGYGGYGEDEGYGDDTGYGEAPAEPEQPSLYDNITAPNLKLAHRRLQPDWIQRWLQKPPAIMPGTKMPNHWGPDGNVSAFAMFPPDLKAEYEAMFGKTAEEQQELIVRWLFAAGQRNYTVGQEQLVSDDPAIRQAAVQAEQARRAELDAQLKAEAQATIAAEREAAARAAAERGETVAETPAETPAQPEIQPEEPRRRPPATGRMPEEEAAADREAKVAELMTPADPSLGRVVGLLTFTDEAYRPRPLRVTAECSQVHQDNGTRPSDPKIVVNPNGTLSNVVAFVTNPPDSTSGGGAGGAAFIDQIGCEYIPHTVSLTAGEKLQIRNTDPFAHNLNLKSESNKSFNVSQPVAGMVYEQPFDKAERGIPLKCDVHAWMNAVVHVFDHPYHAVSNESGVFAIDLPPGQYTLQLDHEVFGSRTVDVTVEAGQAARVDLTFPQ